MPKFIKLACATVLLITISGLTSAANSSLTHTMATQTPTQTFDWADPAGGSINGYSGDTWVTGTGSLFDGGNDTYNGWVTTEADAAYTGINYPEYQTAWKLTGGTDYKGRVEASTFYVPTGIWPVEENYRSESTGTAEIRGDFRFFQEKQVVVDSYTTSGTFAYDAHGGGTPPLSYPDEGVLWVTTAETNKKTTRSLSFGWPVSEQWHYGDVVRFNLYARGKQYMRCEEEEDVSLETKVLSGDIDNPDGWEGTLVCYDVWPDGTMTLVALHPIG